VRRISFGSGWAANREEYPRMRSEAKHFSMRLFFEGKSWERRNDTDVAPTERGYLKMASKNWRIASQERASASGW
jgi:hypothetical protein